MQIEVVDEPTRERQWKRPRTQSFLDNEKQFESAKRTCTFLITELGRTVEPSSSSPGTRTFNATKRRALESAELNIRKQMHLYDRQFSSYQEDLRKEVNGKLRLRKAFDCLEAFVEAPANDDWQRKPMMNPLSLLNQGPETTTSLKALISDFAGVPDGNETSDWQELSRQLRIQ